MQTTKSNKNPKPKYCQTYKMLKSLLEKAFVMMLKVNQKIILYKFPFCFYICVIDKMFKYSDKMC